MKTIKFIAAAVMCLLYLTANAQSTMRIHFEGDKQMEIPVSTITSIDWFTNETSPDNPTSPDISPSGVQAVDLGLSVKWANMNIGATSMDDYGDYFAWGETVGYNDGEKSFDDSTYKYYMKIKNPDTTDKDGFTIPGTTESGYTKYVTKSAGSLGWGYDGFYDDKTVLDPEDDAAVANWGGSWRMPTKTELDELRTKCTWQLTALNGKRGHKVTGPNGNFIFLPFAGECNFRNLNSVDVVGYYWSSSLHENSYNAYYLDFNSSTVNVEYTYGARRLGLTVRAVCP